MGWFSPAAGAIGQEDKFKSIENFSTSGEESLWTPSEQWTKQSRVKWYPATIPLSSPSSYPCYLHQISPLSTACICVCVWARVCLVCFVFCLFVCVLCVLYVFVVFAMYVCMCHLWVLWFTPWPNFWQTVYALFAIALLSSWTKLLHKYSAPM